MSDTPLPFAGYRVLDVGTFIAGPAAATVMADFGADVVKVETPGEGDPYRHLYRTTGMPVSEHNYCWTVDARSKRSIVLDLKRPEGREVLYRLVRQADVLVTNFPIPVRERLGVDWPTLSALNPRLVYASLSGFGESGPEAAKPGFDSTAYWARSGLMDLARTGETGPPTRSVPGQGDHPTAMAVYGGIVTALLQRERTGKGGWVHASLLGNGIWANACQVQAMLAGAPFPYRPARSEALNALSNLYRCGDGRWFLLAVVREDRYWEPLCRCLGLAGLPADPRFAGAAERRANARELIAAFDAALAQAPWAEWRERLQAAGITFAEVNMLADVVADPQAVAAGALVPLDDPAAGTALTVGSPFHIAGLEKAPARAAPAHGADTEAVLREAGYGDGEIAGLKAAGALG